MKTTKSNRSSVIEGSHGPAQKPPHDRDQLRKRLLQMILKSEAERRGIQSPATRQVQSQRAASGIELAVYDPENMIGRERAAVSPSKRA
jgi:hypothetical protein